MKVRDILHTYQSRYKKLKQVAEEYYDTHYCGYMGEWVNGSEAEYDKLLKDVEEYLESDVL